MYNTKHLLIKRRKLLSGMDCKAVVDSTELISDIALLYVQWAQGIYILSMLLNTFSESTHLEIGVQRKNSVPDLITRSGLRISHLIVAPPV